MQFYGVPPGAETLEETRLREAREKEERERREREIEEERAKVGQSGFSYCSYSCSCPRS